MSCSSCVGFPPNIGMRESMIFRSSARKGVMQTENAQRIGAVIFAKVSACLIA